MVTAAQMTHISLRKFAVYLPRLNCIGIKWSAPAVSLRTTWSKGKPQIQCGPASNINNPRSVRESNQHLQLRRYQRLFHRTALTRWTLVTFLKRGGQLSTTCTQKSARRSGHSGDEGLSVSGDPFRQAVVDFVTFKRLSSSKNTVLWFLLWLMSRS